MSVYVCKHIYIILKVDLLIWVYANMSPRIYGAFRQALKPMTTTRKQRFFKSGIGEIPEKNIQNSSMFPAIFQS